MLKALVSLLLGLFVIVGLTRALLWAGTYLVIGAYKVAGIVARRRRAL
jgi:hypothetical protein